MDLDGDDIDTFERHWVAYQDSLRGQLERLRADFVLLGCQIRRMVARAFGIRRT